jgi:hypothetical protein
LKPIVFSTAKLKFSRWIGYSPSISNSSPVIPILESTPKAKTQIQLSPVNVISSEDLQAEKAKREEIEKREAALKAERERKEAIDKHINSTRNTIFYSTSTHPRNLI